MAKQEYGAVSDTLRHSRSLLARVRLDPTDQI